jgi:hypothetical protein
MVWTVEGFPLRVGFKKIWLVFALEFLMKRTTSNEMSEKTSYEIFC